MTLAAPRSRQGKLTLVLAILAAVVASVGVFLWASSASADLPATTATLTQSPATPGTVNPGDPITYTLTVTTTGPNTTGAVILSINVGAGVDATTISPTCPAANTGGAGITWTASATGTNPATCTSSAILTAALAPATMTVTADAGATGPTGGATATADDAGAPSPIAATADASVGALDINGVECTGGGDAAGGSTVTVSCTVPAGLTYCSDDDANGGEPRSFDDTLDMTVDPTTALAGGPTAGGADNDAPDTASVDVTGDIGDSVTVTLSVHAVGDTGGCTDIETVVDFVTLGSLAGGAFLRHVDVDCGTEYAFDSGDSHFQSGGSDGDYDGWAPGEAEPVCNGLLSNADISSGLNQVSGYALDDPDDAIGSEHTVCIIGGALTDADLDDITFTVTPAAPHQDPVDVNNNKLGIDVNGDDVLEPCVAWRVGDVGVEQSIAAIYDPSGELIYSNGVRVIGGPNGGDCPNDETDGTIYGTCQVLIKEWNSIDTTKIVQDSGDRDGNDCVSPGSSSTCANLNFDGDTININGITNFDGFVVASGRDFVEYVIGSHLPNYNGPIDGVEQTFSVSGDCGIVTVEDPLDAGNSFDLTDGQSLTLPTNSDKGVAFSIEPVNGNDVFDCVDGECLTVFIDSVESTSFDSNDPDTAASESVELCFNAGPGPEKQPMLAWVGQRVVLSHDWTDPATGDCPWYPGPEDEPFYVRYLIQAPSPGALSNVPGDAPAVVTGPDYIIVPVEIGDDCISHVIYESQNQGRVDVTAHVVEAPTPTPAADFNVISPEYDFWYYYMKIEDVNLGIVPGARTDHNAGSFTADGGADVTEVTSNVSADELLRVTVRGWVLADNCPVKDAGADINGLLLPANRCTFPTDWAQVIGDDDQFDILGANPLSCSNVAGPFSLLNGLPPDNCDDSEAPHVDGGFRESVFSNGSVGSEDAPMPPALITLTLSGSGFLHGADKDDIYPQTNQYFVTHIPAEPQILVAGSGYQWHTWNGSGDRSGLYEFWTSLAGMGNPITSCPGDSVFDSPESCVGGVDTGGYDMIQIYSDNHGEAMAWVNGDANLTFDQCDDNLAAHAIVLLLGHYCENNDTVGTTTVTANADYPDKKPHQDVDAPQTVTITWTWGGTKDISVVADPADATGQFNYVVFRVTDRDGGCSENNSLHPVLGELVEFTIDSNTGIIFDDVNGNASAFGDTPNGSKQASVVTFDADSPEFGALDDQTEPPADRISFDVGSDICEAWIHVSESLLNQVNVTVVAHDPEGTVTFDTKDINPTPTPSPVPTEEPPFSYSRIWGDSDCSGAVAPRDGQAILKHFLDQTELSQDLPCPALGEHVTIAGNDQMWGDWDCSGAVAPRDGQIDLKQFLSQTPPAAVGTPCPTVGGSVDVEPILP